MCCVCACFEALQASLGIPVSLSDGFSLHFVPSDMFCVLQPYRTVRYAPSGFVKRRSAELLSRISAPRLRQRLALPDFYSKDPSWPASLSPEAGGNWKTLSVYK